jgi:hypothetical protein
LSRPTLTEAEFDELKRKRDEGISEIVRAFAAQHGGDPDKVGVHVSYGGGTPTCYCACADGGPCQHVWNGPAQDILDDEDEVCGSEVTCSRCGMGSMSHSLATDWD